MKILVTGAGGRIGRKIIPLLANKFEWVLTDREAMEVHDHQVQALDITNYHAVLAACVGVDAVLHLAIASIRDIVTDKAKFMADEGEEYLRFNQQAIETNIRGTYHVFEAARQAGVSRVVYGSSLTVLWGSPQYETLHDDLPPRPSNFYAVTKCWGEQLGEYFARAHGLTVYCLRFGTPYPQPEIKESQAWLQAPAGQRSFVTFEDLAASVEAALTVWDAPSFGAYMIVSAADGSIFDYSKAREIGWQPRWKCEADGRISEITEMS